MRGMIALFIGLGLASAAPATPHQLRKLQDLTSPEKFMTACTSIASHSFTAVTSP